MSLSARAGTAPVGRAAELETLAALLDRAEAGESSAMVLRGEPGIGKTALLRAASELAAKRGMGTVSVAGIEAEAPLGYATLHRLLRLLPGSPGGLDQLPPPQRDALQITLGLVPGPPPNRFLVGLGLLTLLERNARDAPLIVVIDDAHWVDPESEAVLGFSARRLQAERLVMFFAAREGENGPSWLSALPELRIGPLPDHDAAELLIQVTDGPVNPGVQARLVAAGSGNPLALIETVRQLTPGQLAGADALPRPMPAGGSLHQLFTQRLGRLSAGTRLLLAVAAAEPAASMGQVWNVAHRLGASPDDAAAIDGPVSVEDIIQFSHPLERSVAYYRVPLPSRRRIHGELARELDSPGSADRVAWHLAMAATGPDEEVAARLEQAAYRVRDRGGYAATTELLHNAAVLSCDEQLRTTRLLAATEAALTAARPDQARAMLEEAAPGLAGERSAALALRLSGEVHFAAGAYDDAVRELLPASRALMAADPALGREILLKALIAAQFAATDVFEEVHTAAATIIQDGLPPGEPRTAPDLFLSGFLYRLAGDPETAAGLLRQAHRELERSALPVLLPPLVSSLAGAELMDEALFDATVSSQIDLARRTGALTALSHGLAAAARSHIQKGRFHDAEVAIDEISRLVHATSAPGSYDFGVPQRICLLCWRGAQEEAMREVAAFSARFRPHPGIGVVGWPLAILDLSRGRYRDAFDRLAVIAREDRLGLGSSVLPDFIEAAVRSGQFPEAKAALDRLAGRAVAGGGLWGLSGLALSQALLASDDEAERYYRKSVELLGATKRAAALARGHLLLGEWLRRQRRRREARAELQTAHGMFADMGASGFAERARIELLATGGSVRKRAPETATDLTPQEAQIAELIASGNTNGEVAAKLFISPATVSYHLRKIYQKLGVTSRTQMAHKIMSSTA